MESLIRTPTCLAGLAVLFALIVGCDTGPSGEPSTLVDGSPARPASVSLEGVDGPSIETAVRVIGDVASADGSRGRSCAAAIGARIDGAAVERVGTSGASVTFMDARRRAVHGCDATDGAWCGHAFGRVEAGRLRDPRLSLSCRDAEGAPLGFAWVQPTERTTYVVVQQPSHAEVYPVAGGAPVRVTTSDVDVETSSARFAISEHAKDGRRLHRYELEAQVSG